MSFYLWEKNQFRPATSVGPSNRAFLYGDGFFETFLTIEGTPSFWKQRLERMHRTMSYLWMKASVKDEDLLSALTQLPEVRDHLYCRVRLSVFRKEGGKYLPENLEAGYTLKVEPLNTLPFNDGGVLSVEVAHNRLPMDQALKYKLTGKHHQVRLALEAKRRGVDELIVLNDAGDVSECISGNLIMRKKDKWLTPALDAHCLDGVVRRALVDYGVVEEVVLRRVDIDDAVQLAVCNSIRGVQELIWKGKEAKGGLESLQEILNNALINSVQDLRGTQP